MRSFCYGHKPILLWIIHCTFHTCTLNSQKVQMSHIVDKVISPDAIIGPLHSCCNLNVLFPYRGLSMRWHIVASFVCCFLLCRCGWIWWGLHSLPIQRRGEKQGAPTTTRWTVGCENAYVRMYDCVYACVWLEGEEDTTKNCIPC